MVMGETCASVFCDIQKKCFLETCLGKHTLRIIIKKNKYDYLKVYSSCSSTCRKYSEISPVVYTHQGLSSTKR